MSDIQKEQSSLFSHQLKLERSQRGWSQARLADELHTDVKTVSRWECGDSLPSPYLRERLSALLGLSLQDLGLLENLEVFPVASPFLFDPAIPLPPAIPLVGRDNLLSALRQHLLSGENNALSAFSGLPGVGKTALSVTLANDPELRSSFRDGILWAGLGPKPNLLGHALRWGAMLGMSPDEMSGNKEAVLFALHRTIGSRRILFILDDAWRPEDALQLKLGGPSCAHIVTTRFPPLAAEISTEGAVVVEELTEDEGITLLRTLAPQVVKQEPRRVHELVKAVGGLPLALLLIGNYLRIQAYRSHPRRAGQAVQLLCDDAQARLDLQESRSAAERHSSQPGAGLISLRSIIAVTDQQLDEHVRRALSALAVFPPKPNSFAEEAALAVANCDTEVIDALIDTGLLQLNGANRYMLHPTIADYGCYQLLENNGDFDLANLRLITYITTFVEQHCKDYEILEIEYTNIFTALETAFVQDGAEELFPHLAVAFAPFLLARGLPDRAEHHLRRAYLTVALSKDGNSQAMVIAALEDVFQHQGKRVNDILALLKGLEV